MFWGGINPLHYYYITQGLIYNTFCQFIDAYQRKLSTSLHWCNWNSQFDVVPTTNERCPCDDVEISYQL